MPYFHHIFTENGKAFAVFAFLFTDSFVFMYNIYGIFIIQFMVSFILTYIELYSLRLTNLTNVQEAAYWGIIGEGGWYPGNSSQDIVDSVNDFINNLSQGIPSVTTGSPTVPRDALNPAELQDVAYYQTFQPTPNTNYQLWLGNLKKFKVDFVVAEAFFCKHKLKKAVFAVACEKGFVKVVNIHFFALLAVLNSLCIITYT